MSVDSPNTEKVFNKYVKLAVTLKTSVQVPVAYVPIPVHIPAVHMYKCDKHPFQEIPSPGLHFTGWFGFKGHDFSQITWGFLLPAMCSAFLRVLSVTGILRVTNTYCTGRRHPVVWIWFLAPNWLFLTLPAYSRHCLAMAGVKMSFVTLSIYIMSSYLTSLQNLTTTLMSR